jgi:hypothetical protein
MDDELPVMIESTRTGYRATTPYYPKLSGQGPSEDDAVNALMLAIQRQLYGGRARTPLVTNVEIRTRRK